MGLMLLGLSLLCGLLKSIWQSCETENGRCYARMSSFFSLDDQRSEALQRQNAVKWLPTLIFSHFSDAPWSFCNIVLMGNGIKRHG